MKFILYDILLNVFDVDEAYEAHASIDHKFILISTPGDKFRNFKDDKFLFDFFKDDTYKYHSSEKVNTRFRVFSNENSDAYNDYYAHLKWKEYFILAWRFKKFWILQKDSIMWIINLLVAVTSILFSTFVALKLSNNESPQKVELTNPMMINEKQLDILTNSLDKDKLINLDSVQLNKILYEIQKNDQVKVFMNKNQFDALIKSIKATKEENK
jgi:hypothetical protein